MRQIYILIFTCIYLSACGHKIKSGETVTVDNDVEIPIAACVEANSKILGNSVDPIAFCKCLIPKFYQDLKNDPEILKLLKEGNWHDLAQDKQEVVTKYFQSCMTQTATTDTTVKFTITPRMALVMKNNLKQELIGSEIEKTNDVDKYCDCIINSLQTDFTIKEVMQDNFNETEKYQKTIEKCLKATKKN